ncbi:MAG: hypothetical protein WBY53_09770, partial [Acidobacteriaceae bacterium]
MQLSLSLSLSLQLQLQLLLSLPLPSPVLRRHPDPELAEGEGLPHSPSNSVISTEAKRSGEIPVFVSAVAVV